MTDHGNADVDVVDDEFERLGRRAAAELRLEPPADGPRTVLRTARRRQATVAAMAAGATVAIVVAGLIVANSRVRDESAPAATVLRPRGTVVVTTTPSDLEKATPPDAARTTPPGTWRAVADPSALAPEFPAAAVWTGTEVVVIGSNVLDTSELSPPFAVAYDVGQDGWRSLADPPPALGRESLDAVAPAMQWTGSNVLAATSQGAVYGYDPVDDRWETRASADQSMSLPAEDALVAVSARGVLARSSTGWWWYENSTDQWEPVAAPTDGGGYSTLAALDQDRIVAVETSDASVTSAVFEIASRSWRTGPAVEAPVSDRGNPTTCDVHDGLLVCWTEGFASLDGIVIDPLVGVLDSFELGEHSNTLTVKGLPWMTHAWKLLSPRTAMWEDLPSRPDSNVDSYTTAAWTGSEILFFGGNDSQSGKPLGATAAYTPLQLPGR